MRVLVDVDGVLADWNKRYDDHLDGHGAPAALIPRRHEQRVFNLNADRTDAEREIIAEIMVKPGFYANLEPIPGGRAALRRIRDAGHEVFIVTSPWISNPTCASDKLNWVSKHLGQSFAERTIVTTDKTVVHGDILIDDRPGVHGVQRPTWHQIFYTQPWNADEPGHRINSWAEVNESRLREWSWIGRTH